MGQWYVLTAMSGKETESAKLMEQKISHELWQEIRILKKIKVFRSKGRLRLVEDVMFSGYVLVNTDCPEKLAKALQKAGDFPKPLTCDKGKKTVGREEMIPLEPEDLKFLKSVCGENLQNPMGITQIFLNGSSQIVRADGVLRGYLNQIVKLNLHKRFAVVEIDLFNRKQSVLFSIRLKQDLAG